MFVFEFMAAANDLTFDDSGATESELIHAIVYFAMEPVNDEY